MKKRIFSMLTAITMLMCAVGFVPISAHAEIVSSGECGVDGDNLTWTLDDEGILTISGTGDMADYTLITNDPPPYSTAPWYTDAMRVGGDDIKKVIIEDGVTSIGENAFALCYDITSTVIPSSVTAIGNSAFYQCNELTDVNIPEGVTTIGTSAFSFCNKLTDISIPESVTSIGSNSFYACYKLTEISVDENNKNYTSEDGVLFNKDKTTLIQCPAGKADAPYAIPDSVIVIDDYAFAHGHLTQVTIPDSVISIGAGAFFFNKSIKSITIPGSVKTISRSAFWGCTALMDVVICDGVETIEDSAFNECRALTNITIPDSVIAIGDYAFECCSALESITVPDSVTSLGNYAFYLCEDLKSAVIGKGVTSLEHGTFQHCGNLTSVTIPVSVTNIDMYVFYKCDSLTDVYYGGSEEDWNNIDINEYANECLLNTEIHYNSLPAEDITVISAAEELKAFADNVNAGNTYKGKTVALTADIDLSEICGADINGEEVSWTPVGADNSFNGTFDGNGHTISGLYINSEDMCYAGLFGFCDESSRILNLVVDGSVKTGYPSFEGGWANPPIEIGGIAGASAGKIANCHNKAAIIGLGNGAYAAGICGMGLSVVIENCINTGVIVSEYKSEAMVAFGTGYDNDNCYYLEGTSVDGNGAQAKTAAQFASGEVTYLLNGKTSDGDIAWYQNIGEDDFPVLDNTHSAVLFDGEKYYNNEPIPSNKINAYLSKYWLGDNDYKAPRIFMTYEELEAYTIENNLDKYNRLLELYPRSFFEEKFLYVCYIEGGSGSNRYTVNTSEEANAINIEVTRVQEGMTTDYFKHCLYAEIDKSLVSKDINITFVEKQQTTTYPYAINGLRITNTAGEEIEQVQKNTSFIVEADITKTEERNEKDYLFVAVYDTDGALTSLDYVKAKFSVDGECYFGFSIPPQEKSVGSVKAFVWNTFNSMEPLAENKTLSLQNKL